MVRSCISSLIALFVCVGMFIFADIYLEKTCDDFYSATEYTIEQIEQDKQDEDAIYNLLERWSNIKNSLNMFVPHNDINQVEPQLNEAVFSLHYSQKEIALTKLNVVKNLVLNLPNTYRLKLGNIL